MEGKSACKTKDGDVQLCDPFEAIYALAPAAISE